MGANQEWENEDRQPRRWVRALPGVAALVLGAALTVWGLPADTTDDLVVDDEVDGEPADDGDPPRSPDPPPPDPGAVEAPDEDHGPEELGAVDPLPGADGVLYALSPRAVARVDLATGTATERALPPTGNQTGPPGHLAAVDDRVVIVHVDQSVLALPTDLDGQPQVLHESGVAVGLVNAIHAGPGEDAITFVSRQPDGTRLRSMRLDDGSVETVTELPRQADVLHLAGRTAVLGVAGEIFRYDLDASRGERVAVGTPIAADAERVVYVRCGSDLACALMSQRFDDDDPRRVADGTVLPGWPGEPLSPDGRWLRVAHHAEHEVEWQVFDLETGERLEPPRNVAHSSGPPTNAWSPDGRWLLEPTSSGVRAWHPERDEVVDLELGMTGIQALATGP